MKGKQILIPLISFAILIGGCQLLLEITQIPGFILPKPSLIFVAFWDELPFLLQHLQMTLYEAIVGFAIAVVAGVVLSLGYLFIPQLEPVIVPLAIAVRNVPFVALAPILFITLGYGPLPKIIIVAIVSFFPVMSNLAAGFQAVKQTHRERFFVYRASKWQLFRKLQLPTAVPYFVVGLEISVSNVVIAAIVGELLGAMKGLGYVIMITVSQYKIDLLMAAVVLTTAVSILVTWLVLGFAKLTLRRWLIN